MQTPPQKPEARKMRTGYGLHAGRLSFSGQKAMRSIKFPLFVEDEKVRDGFCENVKSDYRNCVGDLNLSGWYEREIEKKEKPTYSVFDFWLDSLRAGFIFAPSNKKLKRVLKTFSSGEEDKKDELFFEKFDKKSTRFCNLIIHRDRFIKELVVPNEVRSTATLPSFTKKILLCAGENLPPEEKAFLEQCAQKMLHGTQGKKRPEQNMFLDSEFGIDKSLYPTSNRKLTAYPLPTLEFLSDESEQGRRGAITLLNRVAKEVAVKVEGKKPLQDLLGADASITALSNFLNEFLSDLQKDTNGIFQDINAFSPLWAGQDDELRKRLSWLQERAKRLETSNLVSNWAQYRSSGAGKIKSWITSYLNQKVKIEEDIKLHQRDIAEILKKTIVNDGAVDACGKPAKVGELFLSDEGVRKQIEDLKKTLDGVYDKNTDTLDGARLEIYRTQLADAKTELNRLYHERYPDYDYDEDPNEEKPKKKGEQKEGKKSEKRAEKDLKHLFKDIKRIPEFVGDAKKKRFTELMNAPKVLGACIKKLEAFESARPNWGTRDFSDKKNKKYDNGDIGYAKDILEKLRRKYYGNGGKHGSGLSGTKYQQVIDGLFQRAKLSAALSQNKPLYKHPKSRHKVTEFSCVFTLSDAARFLKDFVAQNPYWDKYTDRNDIADALWFEKLRIGVALNLAKKEKFSLADIGGELKEDEKGDEKEGKSGLLKELATFLELLKTDTFTKDEFGRIVQNYILSVASGRFSMLTTEEVIERYCVQPMNSEQNYPLFYKEGEKSKKEWGILLNKDEELRKKELKSGTTGVSIRVVKSKEFADTVEHTSIQVKDGTHLGMFRTSPYQMQFINKAFGVDDKKESWYAGRELKTALSSYSFVVEEKVKIKWDMQKGTVVPEPQKDTTRLFVSIPFTLESSDKNATKEDVATRYTSRKRVMGIDTGEYGLAYVILDKEKTGEEFVVAKEFIYSNLIAKIRDFISTLKSRQIRGTFSMPSTKLARVRENAITSLRNQVSAIALQYGAMPVYEDSIDNFETGSGKVSKVYKSVQVADVGGESDADKAEVSLVWGQKSRWFGTRASSYATSYICMACGHSPFLCNSVDKKKEEKTFARPSVKDFFEKPEYAKARKPYEKDRNTLEERIKERGNSALYVCPKPGCCFVSDADKQAAYWIGLKRISITKN